ncbi:MAG TPA: hypothetical protein VJN22_07025 [Candidatus Eremiobacteraceae bacterium]|nr:hypothetical protein [Candidatus Eremiobacteraceae bacterium]
MHPAAIALVLQLTHGERFSELISSSDRVSWVLPKVKLDQQRANGIVIDEDLVTVADVSAVVTSIDGGVATLDSHANVTTLDVPRRQRTTRSVSDTATVDARNTPQRPRLSPEEAGTADLPLNAVSKGSTWTTRESVLTTLGSGTLVIKHTVTSTAGGRVTVLIQGSGKIVGLEYDLPHLLPGAMQLSGTAIFDAGDGAFVSEHYAMHNSLLKPDGTEHIGFDEHEVVSVTTSVSR